MNAKRAFALSLALLLPVSLLSGCGTLRLGRGNARLETGLPEEPAPTEPAVRHPRAVDVGGVSIYVDDTQYERYQPAEEICTPISDGPLDEFVPATSYGDVFPYVAGRLFTSTEDGYSWGDCYLYGLADSKGRMLTDGIYTAAYPLYCYVPGSYDYVQLPFLQVTRYRDASVIHHEEEYGEWDEINATRETALISMDGSFLLPFSDWSFEGFPDCIVAIRGSAWDDSAASRQKGFTVFDLHGEVLFDSAVLAVDSDCDNVWMQESEGILQVSQAWYDDDAFNRYRVDYYDLTGRHILGPYQNGSAFADGLACVSTDGINYGYVDRSGRWVIEPQYLSCEEFQNGYAVQSRYSGWDWKTSVVLDTAGREVFTSDADWVYLQDGMICADGGYDYDLQASCSEYYDLDGNLLFDGCVYVERIGETTYLVHEELGESSVRFVDKANPEREVAVTDIDSGLIHAAVCQDGELRKGYVWTDRSGRFCLIDEDTLEITELPGGKVSDEEIYQYYSTGRQVDAVTGRVWYLAREKGHWVLFGEDGDLIMRFSSDSIPYIINGYICALDETSCTVYDTSGKVVFRRHLDAGD